MEKTKRDFIDYVRAMYPHVREAYGNPPIYVKLTVPLRDAVSAGVPPADIGDEWFQIAQAIFLECITWETVDRAPQRILPDADAMIEYINNTWVV